MSLFSQKIKKIEGSVVEFLALASWCTCYSCVLQVRMISPLKEFVSIEFFKPNVCFSLFEGS